MQELTMIQQLKSITKELMFTLATVEALLIYLIINSQHTFIFALLALVVSAPFIYKPKYLLWTLVVALMACLVNFIFRDESSSGFISGRLKVVNKTSMGPIVSNGDHSILIRTRENINIGDVITLRGKIEPIVNNSDFDMVTYFKSLNVFSKVQFPSHIRVLETSNDFRITARNFILDGPSSYSKVTPLLLLGLKTRNSRDIYDMSIEMNIVHLFVISGFHISLFYLIVTKGLELIRVNDKYSGWVSLVPIVIYVFILGFPISATRAMMLVSLSVVNKTFFKKKHSTINLLSLSMALMFVYKPWSIFSLSFVFTYIATYAVIVVNMFSFKSKLRKFIWLSVFAFSSNLLIVMHTNHYYSLFGLLYGVVLSPLFVVVYSLTLFLFPIKGVMDYIDYSFIYILKMVHKTNILIDVPKFSINYLFLFYGITLSSIIILVTWNLYTEKKDFLSTKRLIG